MFFITGNYLIGRKPAPGTGARVTGTDHR